MLSAASRILSYKAPHAARYSYVYPGGALSSLRQQIRSVFIQTLDTPNPESLKFVPSGVPVLKSEDNDINGYYVTKNDPINEVLRSPLAKKLFDVEGIKAVYLGADFVTGMAHHFRFSEVLLTLTNTLTLPLMNQSPNSQNKNGSFFGRKYSKCSCHGQTLGSLLYLTNRK
jgi:hypothetical protein